MAARDKGPPEMRTGPQTTSRIASTGTSPVTAEGFSRIGDPADSGHARRVVDLLRYGRREHTLGCARGCPLGQHEPPRCLVGEPIEHDFDKFDESGLFVSREGSVRLISLREHRERVAR
jgi:hypothetical protein